MNPRLRKYLLYAALVLLAAAYRRTPYWDETAGLVPVFRVMAPPRLDTRPWN